MNVRVVVGALAAGLVNLGLIGVASAADLVVSLRTPAGQPVSDAVVSVYPAGGAPTLKPDHHYRMAQQNIQFNPFVLIVPVGATVDFPNLDPVRHHVYSFSPTHRFTLALYSRDETKSVVFDKAGVVALGCNIHDKMVGFIKVVDTSFTARSDAFGDAEIHGLPAGTVTVRVWHPYLKAPSNEMVSTISLPAHGAAHQAMTLDLRAAPKAN